MNQAGGSSQIRKQQLLFKQLSWKLAVIKDSIILHKHLTLSTVSFSKKRCNENYSLERSCYENKNGLLVCSISRETKPVLNRTPMLYVLNTPWI